MSSPARIHSEVKRLVQEAWRECQRNRGNISLRVVAKEINVSPSALHGWLKGKQKPTGESIRKMSEVFFANDSTRQQQFEENLNSAIAAPPRDVTRDPLEQLVLGERPLRVGTIEYGKFASSRNPRSEEFFDRLFDRFASYAGLCRDNLEFQSVSLTDAMEAVCENGELDIVLAALETPDRAKRVKFFVLPISIPVNAVVLTSRGSEPIEHIATALLGEKVGVRKPDQVILPIINPMEVGGLHVRNFLRFREGEYIATEFDIQKYVAALEEPHLRKTRVVVADELTCTQIKLALGKEPVTTDRGSAEQHRAELVFNSIKPVGQMPCYRLGFFVNRQHRQFIEYLEDAFNSFLDSNYQLVAGLYLLLYNDLEQELVKEGLFESAGASQMVCGWLGLHGRIEKPDSAMISLYQLLTVILRNPWPRIIQEANRLLAPQLHPSQ